MVLVVVRCWLLVGVGGWWLVVVVVVIVVVVVVVVVVEGRLGSLWAPLGIICTAPVTL